MSDTARFQCRHILSAGRRCGSPALRHEPFCYFHHTARHPAPDPRTHPRTPKLDATAFGYPPDPLPDPRRATFTLPLPEDRAAIQLSLGEIILRLAANQIDPARARSLLYALQIAASTLPKPPRTAYPSRRDSHDSVFYDPAHATPLTAADPQSIEQVELDPELGLLAPVANLEDAEGYEDRQEELAQLQYQREKREERERKDRVTVLHLENLIREFNEEELARQNCPGSATPPAPALPAAPPTQPSNPLHATPPPLPIAILPEDPYDDPYILKSLQAVAEMSHRSRRARAPRTSRHPTKSRTLHPQATPTTGPDPLTHPTHLGSVEPGPSRRAITALRSSQSQSGRRFPGPTSSREQQPATGSPHRPAVRTPPFHGGNTGSNPVGDTIHKTPSS